MFKRVRWTAIGYVAGVGTSYLVARRVKRTLSAYAPPEVARRSADRVRDAMADGRAAMRAREAELRREFGDRPRLRSVE
jgi:hypothetical protein